MADERRSFEELEALKQAEEFTGREAEIEIFTDLLHKHDSSVRILSLYGLGGVGKTWLLGEYKRICSDENVPSAAVDLRLQRGNFLDFLGAFRSQLGHSSVVADRVFVRFDKTLEKVVKLESKLARSRDHSSVSPIIGAGVTTVASGTGGALGTLTGMGPVGTVAGAGFGALTGRWIWESLGEKALTSLLRQGLSLEDAQALISAEETLTNDFSDSVNQIAETAEKLVLFFDTYEEINPALDEWIRDYLIPKLRGRVLLVCSGRDNLVDQDAGWGRYEFVTKVCEVERFRADEAKEYLAKRGITESELVARLVAFTERLPWALALLFDMQREGLDLATISTDKVVHGQVGYRVVQRFLSQVAGSSLRELIETCAVARRFDRDLLSGVWGEQLAQQYHDKLKRYSFVRRLDETSLALHDIVRSFIVQELQTSAPATYRRLNQRLVDFYDRKLAVSQSKGVWKRDVIEYIYHTLHTDENLGIEMFQLFFGTLDAYRQFDFRDALLTEIVRFEFEESRNKVWQDFCKAYQLMNKGEWPAAESDLAKLLASRDLPPFLRCLALDNLGELYVGQGKYSTAATLYEQSLRIRQASRSSELTAGLGQALGRLCETYAILGRYKEAERLAKRNMTIARAEKNDLSVAWVLKSMGDIYRLWGKTSKAIERLEESLAIFRDVSDEFGIGNVLTQLGRVYTHKGLWQKATQSLLEAQRIFETLWIQYGRANTILFLGNISRFKRQWEDAEKLYLQALELHEQMNSQREIGPLLGSLGYVLLKQERFDKAKECLDRSLEIKERQRYYRGVAVTSLFLGAYYLVLNDIEKALDCFLEALERAEQSGSNFHRVDARIKTAQTLRLLGRTSEIPGYLTEARKLANTYGYPHELALVELLLGHNALDKGLEKQTTARFLNACRLALSYNFYLLDEVSDDIIERLQELANEDITKAQTIGAGLISMWASKQLYMVEEANWLEEAAEPALPFAAKVRKFLEVLDTNH